MALYKSCKCGQRIDFRERFCDNCKVEEKQKIKQYDREVRYSDSNRRYATFYNSQAWITLSDIVKLQYNGLCVVCAMERPGELVASDTTHHIEELKECWELRLVENNLIPLCHACHNKIHVEYCNEDKKYLKNIIKLFKNKYE